MKLWKITCLSITISPGSCKNKQLIWLLNYYYENNTTTHLHTFQYVSINFKTSFIANKCYNVLLCNQ